jgi:hypothetical protein
MNAVHTLTEVRPHASATLDATSTYLNNERIRVQLKKVATVKGEIKDTVERIFLNTDIVLTTTQWREVIESVSLLLDSAHLADEDGWLSLYDLNDKLDK